MRHLIKISRHFWVACSLLFSATFTFAAGIAVTYTAVPQSYQLYPRDFGTNSAQVRFAGTVTTTTGYNQLQIVAKRDGLAYQTITLPFTSGQNFVFDQSISIAAELKSYDFVVQARAANNTYKLLSSMSNIVSGDAIVIYGQSNAQAIGRSGSICASNPLVHPYIRTVGTNVTKQPSVTTGWKWGIGFEGGACNVYAGNLPIGQVGVALGNMLVTQTQIPLLIINGAIGGKNIAYLSKSAPYNLVSGTTTEWLNAYDRLLHRVNSAGAVNKIKTVIWWQGESDTYPVATPAQTYIAATQTLDADLRATYPNMQNLIMVQQRGWHSNKLTTSPPIQEAQRIAEQLIPGSHLLPSNGISQHTDKLHYDFLNGYQSIGQQAAQLVGYLEYGNLNNPSFNSYTPPPKPISITPDLNANTLTISHNSGTNLMVEPGVLANKFRLEGPTGPLTSPTLASVTINAAGQIVLTYNGSLSNVLALTYLSNLSGPSPDVREINGNRALISFHRFPIN